MYFADLTVRQNYDSICKHFKTEGQISLKVNIVCVPMQQIRIPMSLLMH